MPRTERGFYTEKTKAKDLLVWHDMAKSAGVHADIEQVASNHGFVFADELISSETPEKFAQRLAAFKSAIITTLNPSYPGLNRYNVPIIAIDATVIDHKTRTAPYNRLLIAHRRDIQTIYPVHIKDIMQMARGKIEEINEKKLWDSRSRLKSVNYEEARLTQFPKYPTKR